MRKTAYEFGRHLPAALVRLGFTLLLVLATAPAWCILLFGLSLDDLPQLRCFDLG